jgi:hypothetical protein
VSSDVGCYKLTRRRFILIVVGLVLAVGGFFGYRQWKYPYGAGHCCIKQMGVSLQMYADKYGGRFPAGEKTPEASLSLLYREAYGQPQDLRGKSVPENVVRSILEDGGLLGPDSCGWHYVEGLTIADDPELAIIWDKAGLGHNCERVAGGVHEVCYLGGFTDRIPDEQWAAFLARQADLLSKRSPRAVACLPVLVAKIELPDGTLVSQYDGECTLRSAYTQGTQFPLSGGGPKLFSELSPQDLIWYRVPVDYMFKTVTFTLETGDLVSDPVSVAFGQDTANPSSIVFRMRKKK